LTGERWVTFDCYGTLIDWDRGVGDALASLWPQADRDALLARYHEIEPRVQLEGSLPYREVMRQTVALLAGDEDLPLAETDEYALADSLPSWRPFPEVPGALAELRGRDFKVAILSNTDPELLDASLERIGVPVDGRITAAEAGSYKPAPGHWERFFERYDADREHYVHVGASPYHDLEPAEKLGLPAVWINRLRESSDVPRAGELKDLSRLPDLVDELVPAATL
jgi:2-haloalkanoic acid dehalogenase type II